MRVHTCFTKTASHSEYIECCLFVLSCVLGTPFHVSVSVTVYVPLPEGAREAAVTPLVQRGLRLRTSRGMSSAGDQGGGVLSEGRVSSAFSEVVAPLFTLADEPEMDLLLFGRALVYFCLLFVNLLSVCSFSGTAFSGNGCFYFLF